MDQVGTTAGTTVPRLLFDQSGSILRNADIRFLVGEKAHMPTYQYRCRKCGEEFEKVQSFSDDSTPKCTGCGTRSKKNVSKVFGAVGISFKGSGFYKNDSATSNSSSSKESGSKKDSSSSKDSESSKDSGSKKDSSSSSSTSDSGSTVSASSTDS